MTHKLLLADDSVTIQRVVELTFSGEDVQVVTVGDGEQAIARIPVERPDIVLADIGMPKRSGYDVAAFVKGRPDLAHIPVLLLAGAFEPVDEARAQQVRSDGVLVKPFEPQQVIARVRDLIDSARTAAPKSPAVPSGTSFEQYETVGSSEPRTWNLEASAEGPAFRSARPEPPVDDYFDRLDAAFAQLASEPERRAPAHSNVPERFDENDLPTVESLLAASAHADSMEQRTPREQPVPVELSDNEPVILRTPAPPAGDGQLSYDEPSSGRNLVAEMFAALFAAEQGEAAAPLQPPSPPREAPAVTEALVDAVTRRVVERLAPETGDDLVAQIVSEVAERLIREEIARIKSEVGARL